MIVKLIEGLLIAFVLWMFIAQILIPVWRGTMLFPSFRSNEAKLREDLSEAKQGSVEQELRAEIDAENKKHQPKPEVKQPEKE